MNDIIKAMDDSIKNGVPVNAPIWWIDPTDPIALKCADGKFVQSRIFMTTEGSLALSCCMMHIMLPS